MKGDLLKEYLICHPEFISTDLVFEDEINSKLMKHFLNEKDKNNFRSTISEIKFGKLFKDLDFQLKYDSFLANKQTPDWLIFSEDVFAICEVYRLGKSQLDQKRDDFANKLIENVQNLEFSYALKISFIEEYFDTTIYDISSICVTLEEWLICGREIGESTVIAENIEFEILKYDTNISHICCLGNVNSIDIKTSKVEQKVGIKENEITKKLNKYSDLIEKEKVPYFICIDIDFVSGFSERDIKNRFLGKGSYFADYGTTISKLEQFKHMGEYWTELGEFYDNLQLSGIIIHYNQKFSLLLNPRRDQVIYNDRFNNVYLKLMSMQSL